MLKVADLVQQSDEDLKNLALELSKEIFKLKNKLRLERKIDKPHLLREKKKDKARVLTALTSKSLGLGTSRSEA